QSQSMGTPHPQTPHRSPRQAFGANNKPTCQTSPQRKKILARNPLDRTHSRGASTKRPERLTGALNESVRFRLIEATNELRHSLSSGAIARDDLCCYCSIASNGWGKI